jgi:two-component system, NarL family, response regulator DegU
MSDIRILIADDHPIVREGIRDLLESAIGITVVGEAMSGYQTLEMVKALTPDLLLLDMELPDLNGVEVVQKLVEAGDPVRILVLSSHDDRAYISQMLSLGASGYLIKDEVPKAIIEAIRGVARGEKGWVSRAVAGKLSQMMQEGPDVGKDLTMRELEVLRSVVDGKTSAEIAIRLGISVKTVEKYLEKIFKKMNVTSRVEAAVVAVRENFV